MNSFKHVGTINLTNAVENTNDGATVPFALVGSGRYYVQPSAVAFVATGSAAVTDDNGVKVAADALTFLPTGSGETAIRAKLPAGTVASAVVKVFSGP